MQVTEISKMSERISISDVITTTRPVDDYDGAVISSTTHVTKLDVVPASGATVAQATEMIVATLVMSACIAATILGNVLVVLSVFTYRTLTLKHLHIAIFARLRLSLKVQAYIFML